MNHHIENAPRVKIEPRDDWSSSLVGARCVSGTGGVPAHETASLPNSQLHPTAMQYMYPSNSQYSLQHAELVQKQHINGLPRMPLPGLGLASYAYSDVSANASSYLIEERPRALSSDMRMAGPASMAPCPALPRTSNHELACPPGSYSMHVWQQDQKPLSTPAMSPLTWSPQSNSAEAATHTALLENSIESSPASSVGVPASVVAGYRFPAKCAATVQDQATLRIGTVNPFQMSDSSELLQLHPSPASAAHELEDGLRPTSILEEDTEATYRPSQLAPSFPLQTHKRAPLPSAFTDAYAFPATLRRDQSSSYWFSEPAPQGLYAHGLADGVTVPSERSTWSMHDEKSDLLPLVGTTLRDNEAYPFAQYRSLTPNSPVYSSDSSQRSESAGADSDMSGMVCTQLPPSVVTTYASSLSDSASSSPISAIGHAFDEAVQVYEPSHAIAPDEDLTIHSHTYSGLSVGHPTAAQTLQRSLSMQAATIKRPVSARNFSHPYFTAQHPHPKPVSRNSTVPSQGSEENAGLSTLRVRVKSGTSWSLPDAEDCQLAAQSFDSTEGSALKKCGQLPAQLEWKLGQTSSAPMNDASHPVDHVSVTHSCSFEDGSPYINTVVPRRLTRSASKSMATALFADLQQTNSQSQSQDLIPVPPILDGHASDSTDSKHLASQMHALAPAKELPAVYKVVKGKPAGTVYSLSPDTPLHLLPTKKTRGRRPVVSPELNLDAEVEATMASTAEQMRFSGVTRTGKPKKIFVCRVPACNMCFRRSEHLKRHIRSIHTNEKPFPCSHPNCGKAFARGDNLKQHQQNIHRGWTPPEIIKISPEQESSEGADDELDFSAPP